MNHLNPIVPLSPSKRGINSDRLVSSPKKIKVSEEEPKLESRTTLIARPLFSQHVKKNPKNLQLIAKIERMKERQKQKLPLLIDFVNALDIEGLSKSIDFRSYSKENKKGMKELYQAVNALLKKDEWIEKDFVESQMHFRTFCITFAEMMMKVEDPEVLGDVNFRQFFEDCISVDVSDELLLVVLNGDLEVLCRCKESAILAYRSPHHQNSLLHYAAVRGDLEIFAWLMDLGLNPLAKNALDQMPIRLLLGAIATKPYTPTECQEVFKSLSRGLDLSDYDNGLVISIAFLGECIDYSSWQLALLIKKRMTGIKKSWNECLKLFDALLKLRMPTLGKRALQVDPEEPVDLSMRDIRGKTLLHWAVLMENRPLVEKLLQTDLLQHRDHFGRSPLHLASMIPGMDPAILKLLCEKDPALVTERDRGGNTPLDIAWEVCLYDNFKTLYTPGMAKPLLMSDQIWYAMTNQLEAFRRSLRDGSLESTHILHAAVALGHSAIVEACLEVNIDWYEPDNQGYTPIAYAFQRRDQEMIDLLLDHMRQQEISFKREEAIALMTIAFMEPDQRDQFIMRSPMDTLRIRNDQGETPYALAKRYGGPAIYRKLKESAVRLGRN